MTESRCCAVPGARIAILTTAFLLLRHVNQGTGVFHYRVFGGSPNSSSRLGFLMSRWVVRAFPSGTAPDPKLLWASGLAACPPHKRSAVLQRKFSEWLRRGISRAGLTQPSCGRTVPDSKIDAAGWFGSGRVAGGAGSGVFLRPALPGF